MEAEQRFPGRSRVVRRGGLTEDAAFLGMIIPWEYGGPGFSAAAHSAVICAAPG
jgi:alkylation response protein AidB-like acyl-CoA dehydrogenase